MRAPDLSHHTLIPMEDTHHPMITHRHHPAPVRTPVDLRRREMVAGRQSRVGGDLMVRRQRLKAMPELIFPLWRYRDGCP